MEIVQANLHEMDSSTDEWTEVYDVAKGYDIPHEPILWVDANTAKGDDSNSGTRKAPYLTLQAAYNAGVTLFTGHFCIWGKDSSSARSGFDTSEGSPTSEVAGLALNANGVKLHIETDVPVTNSYVSADTVVSGSGDGVTVEGGYYSLENTVGDEVCVKLTGEDVRIRDASVMGESGTEGYIGIELQGDYAFIERCRIQYFDADGIKLNGSNFNIIRSCSIGNCVNGANIVAASAGNRFYETDFLLNTDGIDIAAGCTYNIFIRCSFEANSANDFNNAGGATNEIVCGYKESQITANNTLQDDLKTINDNVLTIINERLTCQTDQPSVVHVGETFRFACSLIDNDTGPIASGSITAGTYNLIRCRAGSDSTITSGGSLSKSNGMVYVDVSFSSANWQPGDAYRIEHQFDTTVDIGGNTYYAPLWGWGGGVSDVSEVKNVMINRDMPYLVDFFEKEVIDANTWIKDLDGAGTCVVAAGNGYIYADIDTGAVANNDAVLRSKYRFMSIPSKFGDSDFPCQALVLEFLAKVTGNVVDIVNQNFVMGLIPGAVNDNTDQDIALFTMIGDVLYARTDSGGTDEDTDVSSGITVTNWNKYKIEVYQTGYKFYINGSLVATHETQVPDEAMYVMFATRTDGVGVVGLNTAMPRVWYEELI